MSSAEMMSHIDPIGYKGVSVVLCTGAEPVATVGVDNQGSDTD